MQTKSFLNPQLAKPTDWIWSRWLKPYIRHDIEYHRFKHFEFMEDDTARAEIEDELAKLLYEYHSFSPANTTLLAQMKYPLLASTLSSSNDQRPRSLAVREGNFLEILACEFAKKLGYDIPVLRLQYNPNHDQSMKGDDILGFKFQPGNMTTASVLIGEGKFRTQFGSGVIDDGYNDLKKKANFYPTSTEFVASILTLKGDLAKAAKIRQLRQRMIIQDKLIVRNNMLFLGTTNQPKNPFGNLEELKEDLLPNLIATNVVFNRNNFRLWLNKIYEKEF